MKLTKEEIIENIDEKIEWFERIKIGFPEDGIFIEGSLIKEENMYLDQMIDDIINYLELKTIINEMTVLEILHRINKINILKLNRLTEERLCKLNSELSSLKYELERRK